MKKIGLVTVTYVNNYGSHLQSFALQQVVRSMGYDTEIISIKGLSNQIKRKRLKYVLSRFYDLKEMKDYFITAKRNVAKVFDREFNDLLQKRSVYFQKFASKAYTMSDDASSWDELSKMCEDKYSTVIVGSDQNWRPANIAGGYYTLEFVPEDVNKMAYSTSFGISKVVTDQKEKARYFLNRLNHISVRENSGSEIVKELTGKGCLVVCDPTILMTKEQWSPYITEYSQIDISNITMEPYILCYFLGTSQEQREYSLFLKKETELKIVSIQLGEGRYYKEKKEYYDEAIVNAGPLDFVNLIKNAQYVCTDSFHGCAFSLIFEKQLYAFYKTNPGSKMSVNDRLDTMLGWAGLKDRIIANPSEKRILPEIDYSIINKNIEKEREMSMQYLKQSLR